MADVLDIADLDHTWSGDLSATTGGDLAMVATTDRSKQHVLRRLMTNPTGYLDHPEYGGGIPQRVGTILNIPEEEADIRGQMQLEDSVVRSPLPQVTATPMTNGVSVSIRYLVAPERTPAALSFKVND